jgi:putative transposase
MTILGTNANICTGTIGEANFNQISERVIRTLNHIIEWREKPESIRCDNGQEYISTVTTQWAKKQGIQIQFIKSGQPWQNAYMERYN